eukprot:297846-Chlamydomonas_euryale.AAC.15
MASWGMPSLRASCDISAYASTQRSSVSGRTPACSWSDLQKHRTMPASMPGRHNGQHAVRHMLHPCISTHLSNSISRSDGDTYCLARSAGSRDGGDRNCGSPLRAAAALAVTA